MIAFKKTRLGLDLKGGVELVYQAKPTAQSKVDTESLNARSTSCASASTSWASPSRKSSARATTKSTSRCPNVENAARAQDEVGKTAQLYFYDWEPNVIGPNGKPAARPKTTVTGGANAGPGA